MGYFAVLDADSTQGSNSPYIERCHLNLWALPGLFPGRRLFYMDIGLEVAAGDAPVSRLQVLLPFRIELGRWPDSTDVVQDLFDAVIDPTSAELIFGGPVTMSRAGESYFLEVGDYANKMRVIRVNPTASKVVEDHRVRSDSSLIEIVLHEKIAAGETAYCRLRVRAFGTPPLWRSTRLSGITTVDFRICDVRESNFVNTERHLRERILDIDRANIFFMAPSNLIAQARSPEFKYLRSLETGAWKRYLEGAAFRGVGGGMLVYYWSHKHVARDGAEQQSRSSAPINADNPFRILLSLQRPRIAGWWITVLQIIIGVLAAKLLVESFGDIDIKSLQAGLSDLPTLTKFFLGSTFLAALGFLRWVRGVAEERFLGPRKSLRKLERWILSVRSR